MPRQSRWKPQRMLLHCYQYCWPGEFRNHEFALTRTRLTNKRKQQNTQSGQISCFLLFNDFLIQPLTPWHKEVQQMFPISSLQALPHYSLHCIALTLHWGWTEPGVDPLLLPCVCYRSTVLGHCEWVLPYCSWMVWKIKMFPLLSHHTASAPPRLLTAHLLPTSMHTAKVEALVCISEHVKLWFQQLKQQ